MNKLLRDSEGGALVEFTLVFPIFLLVAFGTVDFTYMLFDWSMANKAAFIGARTAVVSDPVASGITSLTYSTAGSALGNLCFDPATGQPSNTSSCPSVSTVCTPAASGGTCTNGYPWNESAFTNANGTGILDGMQRIFPRLQRQNVQISYQTNGLGFVGRPNGLPMGVTVSILPSANPSVSCMTHQPYFINALMNWTFTAPAGCPAGTQAGLPIPAFATTLTSEDMVTN